MGQSLPTETELRVSCLQNPDGFGYAIVYVGSDKKRHLLVKKFMESGEAIASFLDSMKRHGKRVQAWAFHARIATHGSVTIDNCHPFTVGRNAVMFHNGVLPVHQNKKDPRTDSETFAHDYLPSLGGVPSSWQACEVIGKFAGHSKLVFLDRTAEMPLIIVNENMGEWLNDVWRSNKSYTTYTPVSYATTYDIYEPVREPDYLVTCNVCEIEQWLSNDVCQYCYSCLYCEAPSDECLCYNPALDPIKEEL